MPLELNPQDAPPASSIRANPDYVPLYQVQPAHWTYDIDPATGGQSRASYGGIVATPAITTPSGLYNVSAMTLPRWRAALARVRAGTGRGRVVLLGDSTTAGAGAGSSGGLNYTTAMPFNYPNSLVKLLAAAAIPVSFQSFMGDQNVTGNVPYPTYDTRVTLGANWNNAQGSFAGNMFHYTTGAANNLTFTPAGAFDHLTVYWAFNGATSSFTTNVDGGASLGTSAGNGGTFGQTGSAAYTVARATHTVNIVPNNNGDFWVNGVVAWDGTTPAVDIIQAGSSGSVAIAWGNTGPGSWLPYNILQLLAPDLTIVDLTINDSNNGTPLASYQTSIQNIINAGKVSGDVLLMVGPPSNNAAATNGTLDQYIAVLRSLAVSNQCGIVDFKARWISWAVTNPIMPYYDGLHPTRVGYQDIAQAINSVLTGV